MFFTPPRPPPPQVLELCECSLFDVLYVPLLQLVQPPADFLSAGGLNAYEDEPQRSELRRPSACRAIALLLGYEPSDVIAASEEGLTAALTSLGPIGCNAALFDRRALVRLLAEVASAVAYAHQMLPAFHEFESKRFGRPAQNSDYPRRGHCPGAIQPVATI
ncbi:hypothetical protein T492DRAFT_428453 [Pavlovales sp. CCMP2436]|nr:hypothetical protein T492DRAFT_428453 [Pavlovales sp. CCMP2436]